MKKSERIPAADEPPDCPAEPSADLPAIRTESASTILTESALQVALQHHQAGRLDEAEHIYGEILRIEPGHAGAAHLSGVLAYQRRHYGRAIALISRAVTADPACAVYRLNLANALQAQGEGMAALECYRQAIALAPDLYEAHFNLGNALLASRAFEAAIDSYRCAGRIRDDLPELHNNLGNALLALHRSGAAIESFRQALSRKPAYAEAFNNLGNAHKEQGELDIAIGCFRQAITLQADYAEAYYNLANTLEAAGRATAAVAAYRQALAIQPGYAEAYYNLGILLQTHAAFEEAIHCYRQAITLQPLRAEPYNNLGDVLASQGLLDEALEHFHTALALKPDFDLAHINLLFHLNNDTLQSPEDYLAEARAFGERVESRAAPYVHKPVAKPAARLRVGFVSGDLRTHPVGFFFESVAAHLDPERFELVAYVTKPGEDAVTARLKPYFAQWHTLLGLSDEVAARKIHEDGVDILVDLAGHTADNRLPVFAWKPAPVQVAWLGYFASTGMSRIDYIIGDPQVLPQSEASHFVEQPWRLPDCYLCFTPPQDKIEVGGLPMLAQGHVTFGCFNKLHKMNDAVVALWSRVLEAVPGSRLLLKTKELTDASARRLTQARFAAHGIEAGRLELEGYTPRADYLANYRRVDIALDPFPYPGGTTTVEALWMGVPVLSRRGGRFLAHAGESLLGTAGLGEWVAADAEDYVEKARAYAADVGYLAGLRARLRGQLLASPLCDAPRFAANLGDALNGMWQRYLQESGEAMDGNTPSRSRTSSHEQGVEP